MRVKITCTGTSSTGKTTLAKRACAEPTFTKYALRYIGADARALLKERGLRNVDEMSMEQRVEFQLAYFDRKLSLERLCDSYITDRSFVDVAAYWLEYTALPDDEFMSRCAKEAHRYDVHLYFPPGLIGFDSDGYRSLDATVHRRIDSSIVTLLNDWGITPVVVTKGSLEERIDELRGHLDVLDV